MKKEKNPDQKDMLETAARLLADGGVMIVCALYRKPMTEKQLCRFIKNSPDDPDGQIKKTLCRLEKSGLICRQTKKEAADAAMKMAGMSEKMAGISEKIAAAEAAPEKRKICWRLTALGEELEEMFAGLERFGRLYEKLQSLGLDAREEDIAFRDSGAVPTGKTGQSGGKEPDGESLQTGTKGLQEECAQRHGWEERGGQFLFRNPHQGYEDWYFYGERSKDKAVIYLITGEEYIKMREYLAAGKDAASAGSRLYLKIEMKTADISPQREAFYVRAEDLIIQESVREC